jgi:hypothetical protein
MNDAKSSNTRWRGLAALVVDAVTHGSEAIERLQREVAARPFALLEQVPPIAPATKLVHIVYDASVSSTHGAIRLCARAVGGAVGLAFDVTEQTKREP